MNVKFKVGAGKAVIEYSGKDQTLEEVIALIKDPAVISLTVVKETPKQYLKRVGPVNEA